MVDAEEMAFRASSRAEVVDYLERQHVRHGGVPAEPAWLLVPYVAVWPIISALAAPAVGWFAIAGDLPTDYVSSGDAAEPRAVLAHFSRTWRDIADFMERGEQHPACRIGRPENWPQLHPLLRKRADLLGSIAANDAAWGDQHK